jgi:hypothetical protein
MSQLRYGSRKFWAMMFWQSMFTWLLIKQHVTGDQFSNLTFVVLGSYFAANVGDKFAQRPPSKKILVNDDGNTRPIE